jgi:ankyrin repeat protein
MARTTLARINWWGGAAFLAGCAILSGCTRDDGAAARAAVAGGDPPAPQRPAEPEVTPASAAATPAAAEPLTSAARTEAVPPPGTDRERTLEAARAARERLAGQTTAGTDAIADRAARARLLEERKLRGAEERDAAPLVVNREFFPVKVTPEVLDLGEVPVGESGVGTFTLVNTGQLPVTLKECKSSCGCTAVDCPSLREISPGAQLEVSISMRSDPIKEEGVFTRDLSKSVSFIFQGAAGDQSLPVMVQARSVAYVIADPTYLDPTQSPDGGIVLRSRDGTPFKVSSMTPPLLAELPQEPAAEHKLALDWKKWEELGSQLSLTFEVDHPRAKRVAARVRPHAARSRGSTDPALASTRRNPAVGSEIDALIRDGNVDVIMARIESQEVAVDEADTQNATLLSRAARWGKADLVQALLERGATVDAIDDRGRTPLMVAAQGKHPAVVTALLDAGASLTVQDSVGTPLCWAAGFGDARSVKIMIERGADVNVVSARSGNTPLIWAAGYGEAESLRHLVLAGANLEATDTTRGATPLIHAAGTARADKVRVLLDAGARLEARDALGRTALLAAAAAPNGQVEPVRVLVEAGADLAARDANGAAALDHARRRRDGGGTAVVEYLVGVGAK